MAHTEVEGDPRGAGSGRSMANRAELHAAVVENDDASAVNTASRLRSGVAGNEEDHGRPPGHMQASQGGSRACQRRWCIDEHARTSKTKRKRASEGGMGMLGFVLGSWMVLTPPP